MPPLPHFGTMLPQLGSKKASGGGEDGGLTRVTEAGADFVDGLYLGDAIRFFLDAKRAGGRSERTVSEYRKKLDLFQRWAAKRLEGEGAVDAPVS